jgi:hypothetical protein
MKDYVEDAKERGSIWLAGCEFLRPGKSVLGIVTASPQPIAFYELIGGSETEVDEW